MPNVFGPYDIFILHSSAGINCRVQMIWQHCLKSNWSMQALSSLLDIITTLTFRQFNCHPPHTSMVEFRLRRITQYICKAVKTGSFGNLVAWMFFNKPVLLTWIEISTSRFPRKKQTDPFSSHWILIYALEQNRGVVARAPNKKVGLIYPKFFIRERGRTRDPVVWELKISLAYRFVTSTAALWIRGCF